MGHLVMGVEMLAEKVRAMRRADGRAVPPRVAARTQAHDRQPSRDLRVRQPEAADDPRGDRRSTSWTTWTPRSTPTAARSGTTPVATRAGRLFSRASADGFSRGMPSRTTPSRTERPDRWGGDRDEFGDRPFPRLAWIMPSFRLSLAALRSIIAVIAIGLAGMMSAAPLWRAAAATVTLAVLLTADPRRGARIRARPSVLDGFALFGWTYLVLVDTDWLSGQFGHDLRAGLSEAAESLLPDPPPAGPPGRTVSLFDAASGEARQFRPDRPNDRLRSSSRAPRGVHRQDVVRSQFVGGRAPGGSSG